MLQVADEVVFTPGQHLGRDMTRGTNGVGLCYGREKSRRDGRVWA